MFIQSIPSYLYTELYHIKIMWKDHHFVMYNYLKLIISKIVCFPVVMLKYPIVVYTKLSWVSKWIMLKFPQFYMLKYPEFCNAKYPKLVNANLSDNS